jgi:hypothetical protein
VVYYRGEYFDGNEIHEEGAVDWFDHANLRGVFTFDLNNDLSMIAADLDDVTDALAEIKGLRRMPNTTTQSELDAFRMTVFAFRLQGVGWTYLQAFTLPRVDDRPPESWRTGPSPIATDDLVALSRRLSARAIEFGTSRVSDAYYFTLIEAGEIVEEIDSGDHEIAKFWSSRRSPVLPPAGVEDAERFADDTLRDLDALYANRWFTFAHVAKEPGRGPELIDGVEDVRYLVGPRCGSPEDEASRPRRPDSAHRKVTPSDGLPQAPVDDEDSDDLPF